MRAKTITINEPKLKKAMILCGAWPFFYLVATSITWAAVTSAMTLSDMTQKRLGEVLFVLTEGVSLIITCYAMSQFLFGPLVKLFRMSLPNGHYLVGQIFESPADCLEQNEKDTAKFRTAQALAELLSCGIIGDFLNSVGPAYEISMMLCGFLLATVFPTGSIVEALIIFSAFALCGLTAGFGRRMVISYISEAGQIVTAQDKK